MMNIIFVGLTSQRRYTKKKQRKRQREERKVEDTLMYTFKVISFLFDFATIEMDQPKPYQIDSIAIFCIVVYRA